MNTETVDTEEIRTNAQNRKMWPMLQDISNHVVWFGKKHSKEDWKDIVTGSFRNVEFVPNIENTGLIALGMRTSRLTKYDFIQLITYIYAFGAHESVPWSEPSLKFYREMGLI